MEFQLIKDLVSSWSTKFKVGLAFGIMFLLACIVGALIYYHGATQTLKAQNHEAKAVITTQASTIRNDHAVETATNQVEASNGGAKILIMKNASKREDARRAAEAIVEKQHPNTGSAVESPSEDQARAAIAIDSIWSAYCNANPDDPECKNLNGGK